MEEVCNEFFKLQAAESKNEVDIYRVKILNTKATVLHLVRRYVACNATFWMAANLDGVSYYTIANPLMKACIDHLLERYVAVQFAAYFQQILDLIMH